MVESEALLKFVKCNDQCALLAFTASHAPCDTPPSVLKAALSLAAATPNSTAIATLVLEWVGSTTAAAIVNERAEDGRTCLHAAVVQGNLVTAI